MALALPIVAVIAGLAALVFSSDRFVAGAAALARHFGISPLVIGMVIIGFGTSLPEMLVSAISALNGQAGIALGNAYGSNIANIALILGVSGLICPITVAPQSMRQDLPRLGLATLIAGWLIYDGTVPFFGGPVSPDAAAPESGGNLLSRVDALIMLGMFALIMWGCARGCRDGGAAAGESAGPDGGQTPPDAGAPANDLPLPWAWFWVAAGLALLLASSYALVWGAVEIAKAMEVSELVIGLTVVAIGTSLPELASSIAAARRREHDLAIGNILGSNLFNTLVVVGIAGAIRPFPVDRLVLVRDFPVMVGLMMVLALCGSGWRGRPGRISRLDGAILLTLYIAYNILLFVTAKAA